MGSTELGVKAPRGGLSARMLAILAVLVLLSFYGDRAHSAESGFALDTALTTNVAGGMPVSTEEARQILSRFDFSNLEEKPGFDLLEEAYNFSEIIEARMPQNANPRLWVFNSFRVEFAKALAGIRTTINTAGSTVKLKEFPDLVPAGQYPGVYQNIARITAAYQVAARLGTVLNFSILVDRDSVEVGEALLILDQIMGALKVVQEQVYPTPKAITVAANVNMAKYLAVGIESAYESLQYSEADQLPQRETEQAQTEAAFAYVVEQTNFLPEADAAIIDSAVSTVVSSNQWATLIERATNLSIPESGEIDGFDEAFDRVMKVQLGFHLLRHQYEERANWLQ